MIQSKYDIGHVQKNSSRLSESLSHRAIDWEFSPICEQIIQPSFVN